MTKKLLTESERRKQKKPYKRRARVFCTKTLRKRLIALVDSCIICGYNQYKFNLEMHHIDGDCCNNKENNLVFLCSIHHRNLHNGKLSEEDTYKIYEYSKSKRDGDI